jgi:hypothetical protein
MKIADTQFSLGARASRTILPRFAAVAILCCGGLFATSVHAVDPTGVPDLRGVWRPAHAYHMLLTTSGEAPPLTTAARKTYEQNLARRKKRDLSFDNMATLCQPPGIPRLLTVAPFRLLQTNEYVVFLSEWNQVRREAYINGKHSTEDEVYFLGNAVGTWDGNVLVIDSKSFNDRTLLDDAIPHSESLHVVERIRLVNNNTLEDSIAITDPEAFKAPWTTVLRFERLPSDRPIPVDVCTDRVVTPLTSEAEY